MLKLHIFLSKQLNRDIWVSIAVILTQQLFIPIRPRKSWFYSNILPLTKQHVIPKLKQHSAVYTNDAPPPFPMTVYWAFPCWSSAVQWSVNNDWTELIYRHNKLLSA